MLQTDRIMFHSLLVVIVSFMYVVKSKLPFAQMCVKGWNLVETATRSISLQGLFRLQGLFGRMVPDVAGSIYLIFLSCNHAATAVPHKNSATVISQETVAKRGTSQQFCCGIEDVNHRINSDRSSQP